MIAVYGATGTTGGLVARALAAAGARLIVAGRDPARIAALAAELGASPRVAAADDPRALAAALTGARCVVACAGPFGEVGEPVLAAAIAAGAHYVDTTGEQGFMRAMYERHEARARHAGVCAVSGMAVEVAPGDLAAALCADHLAADEDAPLDEVTVAYLFERFVPTAGTQRSAIAQLAEPALTWRADRWDPTTPGLERRRIDAGRELGTREVISFPSGEVITVPRHVPTRRVQTYVGVGRSPWLARATGLVAPAVSLLLRSRVARLAGWVDVRGPDEATRAEARFAIVVTARRGVDEAQVVVEGRDVYATSARIAAWAARTLADRGGPAGVLAPAEVFDPEEALQALSGEAGLALATRFR